MRILSAFLVLLSLPATAAHAQAGLPGPFVDVGVDLLETASSSASGVAWAPRVTLNPSADTAVAFRSAVVIDHDAPYERRATTIGAELHHRMGHAGPVVIEGIAGAGFRHTRKFRPDYGPIAAPDGVRFGVVSDHADLYSATGVFGAGLVERLGSRAELRQDFRITGHSEGLDASVTVGVTVPIGRYPTRRAGQSMQVGSTRVRTGERIWVTTADGRTLEGQVGDVSPASIEVLQRSGSTTIGMTEVQRVMVPDGVSDGAVRGALAGGAGMGLFAGRYATAICECHDNTAVVITMAFAGLGAGSGALIGAIADSFHAGRRTIFDRTSGTNATIAPIVTRSQFGATAAFRW
jgi:hypothetical protein